MLKIKYLFSLLGVVYKISLGYKRVKTTFCDQFMENLSNELNKKTINKFQRKNNS